MDSGLRSQIYQGVLQLLRTAGFAGRVPERNIERIVGMLMNHSIPTEELLSSLLQDQQLETKDSSLADCPDDITSGQELPPCKNTVKNEGELEVSQSANLVTRSSPTRASEDTGGGGTDVNSCILEDSASEQTVDSRSALVDFGDVGSQADIKLSKHSPRPANGELERSASSDFNHSLSDSEQTCISQGSSHLVQASYNPGKDSVKLSCSQDSTRLSLDKNCINLDTVHAGESCDNKTLIACGTTIGSQEKNSVTFSTDNESIKEKPCSTLNDDHECIEDGHSGILSDIDNECIEDKLSSTLSAEKVSVKDEPCRTLSADYENESNITLRADIENVNNTPSSTLSADKESLKDDPSSVLSVKNENTENKPIRRRFSCDHENVEDRPSRDLNTDNKSMEEYPSGSIYPDSECMKVEAPSKSNTQVTVAGEDNKGITISTDNEGPDILNMFQCSNQVDMNGEEGYVITMNTDKDDYLENSDSGDTSSNATEMMDYDSSDFCDENNGATAVSSNQKSIHSTMPIASRTRASNRRKEKKDTTFKPKNENTMEDSDFEDTSSDSSEIMADSSDSWNGEDDGVDSEDESDDARKTPEALDEEENKRDRAGTSKDDLTVPRATGLEATRTETSENIEGSERHACPVCRKLFSSSGELKRHQVYRLSKCGHKCSSILRGGNPSWSITRPLLLPNAGLFPSPEKIFPIAVALKEQEMGNSSSRLEKMGPNVKNSNNVDKPYVCSICGKKLSWKKNLKRHEATHRHTKKFECKVCGKMFKVRHDLLHHHSHNHTELFEVIHSKKTSCENIICSICGKLFKRKENLKLHELTHSEKRPFKCDVCGKSFKTKVISFRHSQTHTEIKRFPCSVCGKVLKSKSTLRKHQELHSESRIKPYNCTLCGKDFRQKTGLVQHMRSHKGELAEECPICGKKIGTKPGLDIHVRIHKGEKPYVCSVCGRTFYSSNNLRKHEKVHAGDKPFKCSHCDKTFGTRWNMRVHVSKVHEK